MRDRALHFLQRLELAAEAEGDDAGQMQGVGLIWKFGEGAVQQAVGEIVVFLVLQFLGECEQIIDGDWDVLISQWYSPGG